MLREPGRGLTHPLVSKLAVAVVCGSFDGEGHGADYQGPFYSKLVYDGTAHEANCPC